MAHLYARSMKRDEPLLLAAIEVARRARENGNHPFGAVLAGPDGAVLLEVENTVVTDRDPTGHAETNLIRLAGREFGAGFLRECTLYASTEPCEMCAGAIYWSEIGRVVYGLSRSGLLELRQASTTGQLPVEVTGPMLLEEARAVHAGFWA